MRHPIQDGSLRCTLYRGRSVVREDGKISLVSRLYASPSATAPEDILHKLISPVQGGDEVRGPPCPAFILMLEEGDLDLLEHVAAAAIGADNKLLYARYAASVSHMVVHVGSRVMGKEAPSLDFKEVRGTQGIKEAKYNIAGTEVKVAVASGLANARKIMDDIRAGKADYHFIEIMSCPGGCVNGGGQPIKSAYVRNNYDVKALRAGAIYDADKSMKLRKSHENPAVKALYDEYLGKPNSHLAHELLHTVYAPRNNY